MPYFLPSFKKGPLFLPENKNDLFIFLIAKTNAGDVVSGTKLDCDEFQGFKEYYIRFEAVLMQLDTCQVFH